MMEPNLLNIGFGSTVVADRVVSSAAVPITANDARVMATVLGLIVAPAISLRGDADADAVPAAVPAVAAAVASVA